MSYSLRIEARDRQESAATDWIEDEPAAALGDDDAETSVLRFSAGNPRVEHVTGVVHLYRHFNSTVQKLTDATSASPSVSGPSSASKGAAGTPTFAQALAGASPTSRHSTPATATGAGAAAGAIPAGGSPSVPVDTLCCLAIPGDMSVAEFCTFCGAYLTHIREMRVLRREAVARTVCMVLVRFDTPEHAQSFYDDLNNKPFCSLEPEILCRLVHVKSVELLERPDKGTAPPPAAPAATPAAATISSGGGGAVAGGASSSRGGGGGASGGSEIQPVVASTSGSAVMGVAAGGPRVRRSKQQQQQLLQQQQQQREQQQQQQQQQQHSGVAHMSSQASPCGSRHTLLSGFGNLPPPPGTTELPSCPVCLERLDYHVSGIITTVCNHQFHSECLQKWGDTSCPVCRYCSQPGSHTSRCSVCSTGSDLWICLICGHVGCGRYKAGHASDHWESTQHCYALELDTQRVWDYAGDNYVHRLIQSKTDGKLVEVPSPAETGVPPRGGYRGLRQPRGNCGEAALDGYRGEHQEGDGGYLGPEDDSLKEALIASKLDAIAQEYNHLITTQLDSQRQYFENLLAAAATNTEHRLAAAEAEAAAARAAAADAAALAKEAERKRQAADKKLTDMSGALQQTNKERDFLRSLNETLLANQQDFQKQLTAVKAELVAKEDANRDLQEQVRDLMVYIEAQRLVEASGEDLQQATVLPVPEPQRRAGQRQGRAKQGSK